MNQDIGILANDPEPMYVALANSGRTPAVVYYEDPEDPDAIPTQISAWTQWDIDLQAFADQGVNLTNVNTISIGFGDKSNPQAGGSGLMYFDDIRLYRPRCMLELLQPAADFDNDCVVDYLDLDVMAGDWLESDSVVANVAPDPAGLVAHYKFDGNANDSSGNNSHGIAKGGPTYVAGKFDQAIHLDSFDDYVAIQDVNYVGTDYAEVSVCAWVRTSSSGTQMIASFDRSEYWRLEVNGEGGGPGQVGWDLRCGGVYEDHGSVARVDDGRWHHVAGVFNNGRLTIYVDGSLETEAATALTFGTGVVRYGFIGAGSEALQFDGRDNGAGSYYDGDLDEVYIYGRALSEAEIRYLADDTPGDGESYIAVPSITNLYDEEAPLSKSVNFKDFAVLVGQWLDEQLWPAP